MLRHRLLNLGLVATVFLSACSEKSAVSVATTGDAVAATRERESGVAVKSDGGGRAGGEKARASGGGGADRANVGEGSAGSGGRSGGGRGGRGGGGGPPQAVEVINVQRRDLSESLSVVGSIAPNESASIRPEMNGLIQSIQFEEGQRLKKGDLLLKIDDSELRAQYAQAQARHDLAKLNLERAENLRQTQSNTQADVDRSRSEYAAGQAELSLLRVRMERTDLRAPFDGITAGRTVSVGDYVTTSTIVTTIADLSRLKVEFQVPERFIAKVRPGSKFIVKSTMLETPRPVEGEVYFVNSVADRNTRSTEVKGYLNEPPATLKAGTFATIELVLEVKKDALTVPEGSILVDQRGPQIVLVRDQGSDKMAAFMPVRLGMRARGVVEVTPVSGQLTEKDVVVGAGVGSLQLFQGGRLDPRPLRAEFRVED